MSNNNKQNNKKPPPKQQNPNKRDAAPTPPPPPPAPKPPAVLRGPAPAGRVRQFGKYMATKNPVSFHIESTTKTGKFEVIAVDELGQHHSVASAPNYVIACTMLQTCQDTCNEELDVQPTATWFEVDTIVSKMWDQFFDMCSHTTVDRVALETVQTEPMRSKALVHSVRDEPLVRFGLYAATRKDIKCFELCEKGSGASWFVVAYDQKGGCHICATGASGDEEKMSRKMDEFIKLANQQVADAEIREQWQMPAPPSKEAKSVKPEEAKKGDLLAAEVAAMAPKKEPKKKFKRVMKKRLKKKTPEKTDGDDDDEDRDDKKQKTEGEEEWEEYSDYEEDGFVAEGIPERTKTETPVTAHAHKEKETREQHTNGKFPDEKFTAAEPRSGLAASRFLLDDDDDDENDDGDDDDGDEIVNFVDPAKLDEEKKKNHGDKKPHDGKLTLDKATPIKQKDFATCTGTVLSNGTVEVVGGAKE